MDLEQFVGNQELLERLSKEYELLKASGAEVDYAAWVRQRLREAAAELAAASVGAGTPDAGQVGTDVTNSQAGAAAEAEARGTQVVVELEAIKRSEQLSLSRMPGALAHGQNSRPYAEREGGARPEAAWFLRGEGTGPASQTLASAIFGPSTAGAAPSAATSSQHEKTAKKHKRVVIVSPQRSPPRPASASQPVARKHQQQQQAQQVSAPPVSKLYTRAEPGLFSARPDAYVHPEARPRSLPQAAKRPDWVNAASLQAALRGASSAVPHLQAAAERERRMALSTALARQSLAAGMSSDEARAVALYGMGPPGAAAAVPATQAAAQYDHVLLVAQQLAQQNEQLARAVQENSAQLAQQQALLESALQHPPNPPPQGLAVAATSATTAPAAGAPVQPLSDPTRLEIESKPPSWFTRRAAGGATASRNTSKSPQARTRARSPPLAPTAAAAAGATAVTLSTTAKERDRASRKEALKALLKQVLGGAGLAGGEEGRRRLASGMAEAEKLVAAVQALAQARKAGNGDKGKPRAHAAGQIVPGAGGMVQVVTAALGGPNEARAAVEAAEAAGALRFVSRATSISGVHIGSLPASRAVSRQGSGLSSRSQPLAKAAELLPPAHHQQVSSADFTSAVVPDAELRSSSAAVAVSRGPLGADTAASSGPASACGSQRGLPNLAAPAPLIHGAAAAAAVPLPPHSLPPSGGMFLLESLEDQVQQIVERDAAAFAEVERLRKIDALEQRLSSMVDKVESKLARVLQPLQLNAQQHEGQEQSHQKNHHPRQQRQPQQEGADCHVDGTAVALYDGQGEGGAHLSPRSAGLSVLELQRMLIQINRMESQEQEVRRKWFHDASRGPRQRGPATQPIVVRDGQLGSLDPPAAPLAASSSPQQPPQRRPGLPLPAPGAPSPWSFAHPPTETTLTIHNTGAAAAAATAIPCKYSIQAQDGTEGDRSAGAGAVVAVGRAGAVCGDHISAATLESVLRGRRRFLRAQQLADGDMLVAAEPRLNPVQVMEDLTDVLLDEMLLEQADELQGLCDNLGEHMVKNEFDMGEEP